MSAQIPLALRWPAHQRFATFVAGANAAGIDMLREAACVGGVEGVFLAGVRGSGKTHLLISACAEAAEIGRSAQYLDLSRLGPEPGEAIRQFAGNDLLAIDNLDVITGIGAAEHALFDLYNRCRAERTTMVFAASEPPTALDLKLPDLVSRLSACTQWQIRPLDEVVRRQIVHDLASARGLELDDAVLDWLFTRRARDLGTLISLLDRIDQAALAAQRRVTVPFLRQLFPSSTS